MSDGEDNALLLQLGGEGSFLAELKSNFENSATRRLFGLIAFASLSGFQLLGPGPDGALRKWLERGGVAQLIIGVDAVTTAETLAAITLLFEEFESCEIHVHSGEQGLFHPKVFLFERDDGTGVSFVGSNNLTVGGLVRNVEAVVREYLSPTELTQRLEAFNRVAMDERTESLSPRLLEELTLVRQRELEVLRSGEAVAGMMAKALTDDEVLHRVLLRVVPDSSTRPSQLGIPRNELADFFSLESAGDTVRLQQVFADGTFTELEPPRPLVNPQSNQNRRLEVGGLRHARRSDIAEERWIVVFHEVIRRDMYRYFVLKPGEDGHRELMGYLAGLPPKGNALPSEIMTIYQLLEMWPSYPI